MFVRLVILLLLLSLVGYSEPIVYQKGVIERTPVHWVTVDLNSDALVVRPLMAPSGQQRSFGELCWGKRPLAAINGTFFDTRSSVIVGNVVSQGKMLAEGAIGTSLILPRQGPPTLKNSAGKLGRYLDWSETEFGISGGPTLLSSGQFYLKPGREGFRDPSLFSPRRRSALGVTASNKLLMVSTSKPVSLWTLAHIMKRLKAEHAINLDGGSSTALAFGGRLRIRPRRKLTNVIAVFRKEEAPGSRRGQILAERAQANYHKGLLLSSRGKRLRARSHLRTAVSKAPTQARYWSAYGDSELRMAQKQKAVVAYCRASELYLNHQKPQLALPVARKALQLAPRDSKALLLYGRAALECRYLASAKQVFNKVLRGRPGHPEAIRYLIRTKKAIKKLAPPLALGSNAPSPLGHRL